MNEAQASLKNGKTKIFLRKVVKQRYLFLMSVPIIVWLILFSYVPLFGWCYAFLNFKPGIPLLKSPFVGFDNFTRMFHTNMFYIALRNTVIQSGLALVFGMVLAIAFAVLINEVRSIRYKRVVQTVSYLPHFVSWVVVASITINFLSLNGTLNNLLVDLHLISQPINFMAKPNYFYGILTTSTVWKDLGWNAIIYISSIAGIDHELYEAANADGAGRWAKIWHITLPGIRSLIILLLIMNIGGLVNANFDAQFLLQNAMTQNTTAINLGLYALKFGVQISNFSYGTAIGIFSSVVSFSLVFAANTVAKKLSGEGLF